MEFELFILLQMSVCFRPYKITVFGLQKYLFTIQIQIAKRSCYLTLNKSLTQEKFKSKQTETSAKFDHNIFRKKSLILCHITV